MKNSSTVLTVSFLSMIFLFCSCSNPQIESKIEKKVNIDNAKLKVKLQEINQELEEAILIPDYAAILKYYTEDVVMVQEFRPMVKGKDKMRTLYDARIKANVQFHTYNFEIDSCWISSNEAYEYGTYTSSFSSKENKKAFESSGGYFMIFEIRNDSTFLIKYTLANLDHNPCLLKD